MNNNGSIAETLTVKGYLIKTLRNKIIDTIEKEKGTDDLENYGDKFAVEDSFLEEDDKNTYSRLLMDAFSRLSPHQQEIIYLYYVNELKHEDIAEILGINYQSSKNLLFRSLSKLKKIYFEKKYIFHRK